MYMHHSTGLGEDAVAAAEPSIWDSLSKVLTTGVTAGFNIYNKVQNLTQQQKAASAAQTQAAQLQQYAAMYGQQPIQGQLLPGQPGYGQPMQQQSDFFSGWTIPLLLAGVAAVGIFMYKRK